MKIFITVIFSLFLGILNAQQWTDIGTITNAPFLDLPTSERKLVVLDNGHVVVAYVRNDVSMDQVFVTEWNGQAWINYPDPVQGIYTNLTDLNLINQGNQIYVGIGNITQDSYRVFKWDVTLNNWTSLDEPTLDSEFSIYQFSLNSVKISVSNQPDDIILTFIETFIAKPRSFIFNGGNWDTGYGDNLNTIFNTPSPMNPLDGYNQKTFYNGNDAYYLSVNSDGSGGQNINAKTTNTGGGNQTYLNGAPELRLYKGDPSFQWDSVKYVDNNGTIYIQNDPGYFAITGNQASGLPIIGYTSYNDANQSIFFDEVYDNAGNFEYNSLPNYPLSGYSITGLDMSIDNNANYYSAYLSNDGGLPINYLNDVIKYNGTSWNSLGDYSGGISVDDANIDVFKTAGKVYVLYNKTVPNNALHLKVYNQSPIAFSFTQNNICQDGGQQRLISDLNYQDFDFDSVYVVNAISTDQSIILDANITVTRTSFYNYNSPDNHFKVDVVPQTGVTGSLDVKIIVSDGLINDTLVIPTTVTSSPTITSQNATICLNNGAFNVAALSTPTGGTYSGPFINNNSFNPSNSGIGNFNYNYYFTDGNGCSASSNGTITVVEIPTISLNVTNASCGNNDGSVSATVNSTSGVANMYWNTGQTTPNINGLTPNNYYLNVTDNNGCYAMDVATVTSSSVNVIGNVMDVSCNGYSNGSIDLTVTGGQAPYTYYWSNGATTQDLNNLYGGQYEVFVYDETGCLSTASFIVNEPSDLSSSFSLTNPTACGMLDGTISSTIIGGNGSYTYDWLNSLGSSIGSTPTLTNIGAGVYTLNVVDGNNCSLSSTVTISSNGGPIITLNSISPASCANDGAINVNISSPEIIQSSVWSNGATTEDVTGLSAGNYSLIVTDINGCNGYFEIDVDPLLPEVTNICLVTVDTNTNTNLIVWEKPVSSDIHSFIVYRESSVAGDFQPIDTVSYSQESIYTDSIAYPQIRSWRYKLTTVNNCGIESPYSPAHKTIHVTTSVGTGGTFNINWDQYEGFTYGTFDIYRYTDALGWEPNPIASLPSNLFSYTDTPPTSSGIDYMISVTPPTICTSSKAQDWNSSRSNKTSKTSSYPGNPLGVKEIKGSSLTVQVYPNPSSNIFNINIHGYINSYEIKIYDMRGSLIKVINTSDKSFNIDLTNSESGMYIIEIKTENEVLRQQIIKQ